MSSPRLVSICYDGFFRLGPALICTLSRKVCPTAGWSRPMVGIAYFFLWQEYTETFKILYYVLLEEQSYYKLNLPVATVYNPSTCRTLQHMFREPPWAGVHRYVPGEIWHKLFYTCKSWLGEPGWATVMEWTCDRIQHFCCQNLWRRDCLASVQGVRAQNIFTPWSA